MGGYAFACLGPRTLAGTFLRTHLLTSSGTLWRQQYTWNGSTWVPSTVSSGALTTPEGIITSNLTFTAASIYRSFFTITVGAGDAAFVGKKVFFYCKPKSTHGTTPLDIRVSSPGITSSWANSIVGTLIGALPGGQAGLVQYAYDLGIVLPAVGQTFSVGFACTNDVAVLDSAGGVNETTQGLSPQFEV